MGKQPLFHQGLAIVNAYEILPSVRHYVSRMEEELKLLGVTLVIRQASEIFAYIGSDGALKQGDLPYDFVLFLDKDRYIAKMVEATGIRMFNSARSIELCDDKMETYFALRNQGIYMPKTISAPLRYSLKDDGVFFENLRKNLSFPIVVKSNYGSQGNGVFLAENLADLLQIESELAQRPHLFQEYISTACGKDSRLIIIDGKFVAGYVRHNEKDFRSNLAQGGKGEAHVMSPKQIEVAETAARILGLDYCGVDLLDSGDPSRPILCEVNSNAFIKGAEEVTGINIAGAYAKHIVDQIYKN